MKCENCNHKYICSKCNTYVVITNEKCTFLSCASGHWVMNTEHFYYDDEGVLCKK